MIKRNNKGFTLLELLISIFILTTVIFLGYRVINKSTIDVKNQSNINKGQLTVNNMNEYLTKDLEQASSIALISGDKKIIDTSEQENLLNDEQLNQELKQYLLDTENSSLENNKFTYSYNIRFKDDEESKDDIYSIIYSVEIIKDDKENYIYSVSREETDGVSISFITDEILKEKELPFTVEGNNPYEVSLGYNGKDEKFVRHEFTVSYRLNILSEQATPPPVEDIEPPEEWEEPNKVIDYNVIGFWTADSGKKTNDNLYTWISTDGKILGEAYANQKNGQNDKFNIEGKARPGNNADTSSYIGYKTIGTDQDWDGQVKNVSIGDKDICNISIYISEGTTLEDFKIEGQQGSASIKLKEPLHEGWNHCTITKNGKSKVNFVFTGKLSIDKSRVSSGYAYVVYERENSGNTSNLRGDLIFEITKNPNSQNNTGQYDWDTYIKYNMLDNISHKKDIVQSKSEFKDEQFSIFLDNSREDAMIRARISGTEYPISDKRIQKIVGMKIKLEGNIELAISQFDHIEGFKEIKLTNTEQVYEFKELKKTQGNINGKIKILSEEEVGDTSRILIDFIYEE